MLKQPKNDFFNKTTNKHVPKNVILKHPLTVANFSRYYVS